MHLADPDRACMLDHRQLQRGAVAGVKRRVRRICELCLKSRRGRVDDVTAWKLEARSDAAIAGGAVADDADGAREGGAGREEDLHRREGIHARLTVF
eukprot:4702997-Pleurochrysis_carterae.AAC.1